jgi:hypothetical protein
MGRSETRVTGYKIFALVGIREVDDQVWRFTFFEYGLVLRSR